MERMMLRESPLIALRETAMIGVIRGATIMAPITVAVESAMTP